MLRLNLLGTPGVTGDNGPLTGRATHGRRLALLALLACARGRALRRDRVMAVLWPESPTDRARAQLSDDLYILRSGLGADVVTSDSDEIALNSAVIESDVAAFERLLDEGDAERAVSLVAGPLLDGFHLPDSAEFERWLDAERARLAALYAAALESLAEAAESNGDFGAASTWWRRLAAHDPFSGRITLRLMRALDANGDRAGAIRHARVHTVVLREELDAAPTPEVTAFAERLRVEPAPRHAPAPVAVATEARGDAAHTGPPDDAPVGAAPTRERADAPPTREPVRARRPVLRYAAAAIVLVLVVVFGARALDAPGASQPAPSIAVLPFVDLSATAENAYFSDGLTEQIIATLGRVEGLHVAARTSSFRMRDRGLDMRAIGDTLGVATVLEGSVRHDRERLRVTAKLIDAATGYHLWTGEYDRHPEDVIDVQVEIADAIAGALRLRLTPAAQNAAAPDIAAYDAYLRALYLRNSLKPDELAQAVEYFDRAIAQAPTFALAYAGKATVIAPAVLFGYLPGEEGVNELRALVDRALELDPMLGEAHSAAGILQLFWDWDWQAAERSLRRAVELNPSDAHAWHHLGNYFNAMGRSAETIEARSRAVQLDPLNARTVALLASDHLWAGDYERALELYRRAMKLDPVHPLILGSGPWVPTGPGIVYEAQGRYREAVDEYARLAGLRGAGTEEVNALRDAFERGGMQAFWTAWIEMDRRQLPDLQDPLRTAKLLVLSGDTAQAYDWLDRAFEERNPGLIMIGDGLTSPADGTRTHPRMARIIAAMKLPQD